LPKFTMVLQTSPTNEPGGFVNSLPPIKNPTKPLASGDTVSEPWFIEVVTAGEVNALIQKQVEALTARVAALEAKLNELSPRTEPSKPQQPEGEAAESPEKQPADKREHSAVRPKAAADQSKPVSNGKDQAGSPEEPPISQRQASRSRTKP
jgi:hypothetical protein